MNIDNSLFSSREKEVVDLLLLGKSNKQIALALGISVSTVEFHLKNIYGKLGVKSRTEAVLRLGESIGRDPAGKRGESIVDGIGADAENGRNTIPTRRIPMKQLIFVVAGSLLVIVLGTVFVFALAWPSANRANTPPTPKILSAAISTATTPLATATTFPTTQPKATPLTTSIQISYLGTSFTIPSGLASGSENNIVPLSNEFMVWPAHTEFILHGYPLQNKTFDPQILIYPANEFARMNNASAITIKNLRNLLAAQQVSSSDPLPFFPDEHAQQIFHAREVFLSFQNGSGIRYITEFSQAAFPVLTDTYYTFQGLTRDGNYYVSIIMPIDLASSGNTPMPLESIPFDPNSADASSYPNYVGTVVGMLNSAGGSFNPNLETLDALVQSLLVVAQQ